MLSSADFSYPNLIHSTARLGKTVRLGRGNIVSAGCIFTTAITIGDFNAFNHYVTVGHHSQLGNGNALMTKAHLSGYVQLGDFNLLAVGSTILQNKGMGNSNTLGPQACLMHRVADGCNLIGVPALEYARK